MNRQEWLNCDNPKIKWKYASRVRKIQESLVYNPNPDATTRHHLMDTPEQIEFNNKYYERFGVDLDGTFTYGKYVIFVTQEEHAAIHAQCEDTLRKNREGVLASITPERREQMSEVAKQLWKDDDYRDKQINRLTGESNPFYGKHHNDETKEILSEKSKSLWNNEEYRSKTMESMKAIWDDDRRKHFSEIAKNRPPVSDEARKKMSDSQKQRYINNPMPDDLRHKISERNKVMWQNEDYVHKIINEETNRKRSETLKKTFAEMPDDVKAEIQSRRIATLNKPEVRKKISDTLKTAWTEDKRKLRSTEQKNKIEAVKTAYKEHKDLGGTMSWNEFQSNYWKCQKEDTVSLGGPTSSGDS